MTDRESEPPGEFESVVLVVEDHLAQAVRHLDAVFDTLRTVQPVELQYLIVERVPRLSRALVAQLETTMAAGGHQSDLQAMAALCALDAGHHDMSVPILLTHISRRTQWAIPAAHWLASRQVIAARDLIRSALLATDPTEADELLQYSHALGKLGGRLDTPTLHSLSLHLQPWQAEALRQDLAEEDPQT